jgi:Aspartyl protease/PDZ domain
LLETIVFKQFSGGVIIIEAKIDTNSTRLNFLLDTGSGGISLDSTTCVDLNIRLTPTDTIVNGIAGFRKVPYAFNQKLTVGNLLTDSLNFYVNDYSLLSSTYGEKIDGIIGYSFLSRYILEINFDSSTIKIFSKGKFEYENGGTLLHPTFSRLVSYTFNLKDKEKLDGDLFLDTGAGLNLLLSEDFIRDNKFMLARRKPLITQVQGLGGKRRMRLSVIKRLKFGPYVFRQVPVNLYDDEDKIFPYPSIVGLLGNDIMRRFNMVLNYGAQEIHIKPNTNFVDHFDYAYTGMSLYNFDNKIYIDDIIKDSPAEKAGLKNGDELISVDTNFSGSIIAYEKLLQREREEIKLIISRKEKLQIIQLRPLSIR